MLTKLLERLRGAANETTDDRGPETGRERTSENPGNGRSDPPAVVPAQGRTADAPVTAGAGAGAERDGVDQEALDMALAGIRSAITVELDAFRDRLTRAERDGRDLKDEWNDALAKFARIGGRLAAQARRDLARSTKELDDMPLGDEQGHFPNMEMPPLPPAAPAVELSPTERKAALRRRLAMGR